MTKPLVIRNIGIGEGTPKVIVPIVAVTREAIIEKAKELSTLPIHMVEWRVDFYEAYRDTDSLIAMLRELRIALGDLGLLLTLRTIVEGGKAAVTDEEYLSILQAAAKSGSVDLIDVQMLTDEATVVACVKAIHQEGGYVIGSNHDFHNTPTKPEIIARLSRMDFLGADILKIAVTPNSRADVLELMSATNEMSERHTPKPLVTMSMTGLGSITRICGEVFGSAMTFASVGTGSAPGQIPLEELTHAMETIHLAL